MNIFNLAYKYDIKIDYDGDFDGGWYHTTLKYEISGIEEELPEVELKVSLRQGDIDAIHDGAKKLMKALENHITFGY
jgi:hypothetical protein